jgi:hypothetical protein
MAVAAVVGLKPPSGFAVPITPGCWFDAAQKWHCEWAGQRWWVGPIWAEQYRSWPTSLALNIGTPFGHTLCGFQLMSFYKKFLDSRKRTLGELWSLSRTVVSICSATGPPRLRGSMICRRVVAPLHSLMPGGSTISIASRKVSHTPHRVAR